MKKVKQDKFNTLISFTPRRLKLGHSYGYDKPKYYNTYYIDTWPDPHKAAEDLTKQLSIQLKEHADYVVTNRKGHDGTKYV
jgi:hypothetical protein